MINVLIMIFDVILMSKFIQSSDLPTKEELEEIKKPDLPKDFFNTITFSSTDVLLIEAGSFYIEQCARLGEVRKIIVNPFYAWYGPNVMDEVTGHRFIKLRNGDMLFLRPTPKETGTYYCRLFSRELGDYFEEYTRSVIVFTSPLWIIEIFLHFFIPDCNKETLDALTNVIKNFLCKTNPSCLYRITLFKCSNVPDFLQMVEALVCIHQHLHESFVATLPPNCGVECVNNHSKEELERFSKTDIADLRSNLRTINRETTHTVLQDSKTTFKIRPLCIDGYEIYREKVCIPCNVGKARIFNIYDQICRSCDLMGYSSILGSRDCSECPFFKMASHYGATSSNECIWFFKSTYAILLMVPVMVLCSLIVGFILSLFVQRNWYTIWKIIYEFCYEEDRKKQNEDELR